MPQVPPVPGSTSLIDAVEQLVLVGEKAAIDEIVSLDARERQRELRRTELVLASRIRPQRARRSFPDRPCPRGFETDGCIVVEQAAMEEIMTRAVDAEVICIIRPREPGGKSEVISLDRVSPEFIQALEQRTSRRPTTLTR